MRFVNANLFVYNNLIGADHNVVYDEKNKAIGRTHFNNKKVAF